MNNEIYIMGLDIGGANTDCCIYKITDNQAILIESIKQYLPMWEKKDELTKCLEGFKKRYPITVVITTTTAELADGYKSKKEGIFDITGKVMEVFDDCIVKFVTVNNLKDYEYVIENPLEAAAANWIATAHLISKINDTCIFIDMGTTTTDIIPIKNRCEIAQGHNDLERLCSGELVYTGMFRSNVATIVHEIPIDNHIATVSSELFANTADVHHILGNISQSDYTCSTSDNEDKSIISCKRRLARVVCADLDMLSDEKIIDIARYVEKQQINLIKNGLNKVYSKTKIDEIIITNYADANICTKAAAELGLKHTKLNDFIEADTINVSPTIGCVQMYIDEFLDEKINLIKK